MKLTIREICLFGMIGATMYVSKILLEGFPNVHLLGAFIVSLTVVYRQKALYPIYVFIALVGILNGFSVWWIPYLYIWAVLWLFTMLIPQRWPKKVRFVLYPLVSALHGFLYGTLYAPAQALMFHYSFRATISWIVAGLPWDAVHGVSNLVCGILFIAPLIKVYRMLPNEGN